MKLVPGTSLESPVRFLHLLIQYIHNIFHMSAQVMQFVDHMVPQKICIYNIVYTSNMRQLLTVQSRILRVNLALLPG